MLVACSSGDEPTATGPEGTAPIPSASEEGTPVPGGVLVVAVPGAIDGLNPVQARWALEGNIVGSAMFDTLLSLDENDQIVPRLAESVNPNDTGTSWTIKLRPDVRFHDGSPLDAAAVKLNIDTRKAQPLTGGALDPIVEGPDGVTVVDPLTVRVDMKSPWFGYDYTLAAQAGYMVAPSQIAMGADSMNVAIGTGPFELIGTFASGEPIELTRNEDYWGEPALLDKLTFTNIVEDISRANALEAGDVDMILTQNADTIRELRTDDSVKQVEDIAAEEAFVMLNVAVPPFNDPNARRALALATDRDAVVGFVGEGVKEPAEGPFTENELFYNPESGYPDFDLEAARRAVDDYKRATGASDLSFTLSSSPGEQDAMQPLQAMWADAGIDAALDVGEQTTYLTNLFLGDFQAAMFRNFSYISPDSNFIFWHSSQANGIGNGSINFGQINSPELDAALESARATDDADARRAEYQRITPVLNEYLPYVWLYHNDWAFAADTRVNGLVNVEALGFGRTDAKPWWGTIWVSPDA